MPRRFLVLLLGLCAYAGAQQRPPAQQNPQPKLVLAIVVDQFRYDYLTRFRADFTGGLKRLLEQGAVFTNAHYDAVPTVTAVGHSTFLTGATPAKSGIIGNQWWERTENKAVTSVSDDKVKLLGGNGTPPVPRPRACWFRPSATSSRIPAKAARSSAFRSRTAARFFPPATRPTPRIGSTGNPATSSPARTTSRSFPSWVRDFNATRPADNTRGRIGWATRCPPPRSAAVQRVDASPFGDELLQALALRALEAENLGTGSKTDLLAVSYSSVDYVGHRDGPDSPEIHDMVKRVDKLIGALIDAAEARAGQGNVLVAFSADHGSTPVPEENQKRGSPRWPDPMAGLSGRCGKSAER